MKKSISILHAVAIVVLFFTSCQTDNTTDAAHYNSGEFTLSIGLPDTRLAIGDKSDDNIYPLYWSNDDYIYANGVQSSNITIDGDKPSKAKFEFNSVLDYPIDIYLGGLGIIGSQTTGIIYLPAELYDSNPLSYESTPMFAHVEKENDAIRLKHTVALMRLPIKAVSEDVTLQKITVTSLSKSALSGYFVVNEYFQEGSAETEEIYLSSGVLTSYSHATGEAELIEIMNSNSIELICDTNSPLSTTKERIFYISIPEGEHGLCHIEFLSTSGEKMGCYWDSKGVKAGVVREFKPIIFKPGATEIFYLEPLIAEECDDADIEVRYPQICGYVKDSTGQAIENIAVSDGFSVVRTDKEGYYTMEPSKDAWYIYITIPAEYEIPTNKFGQPCFYQKYPSSKQQYDFTLTPLAGGKEEKFALFAIADPQVYTDDRLKRFLTEAIPGIRSHHDEVSKSMPCYGITLGDIISNTSNSNVSHYRDDMRDGFAVTKTGMPIFQVMGNHDNNFVNESNIINADDKSSSWQIAIQREHETMYGPINYSFERGDAHIIGMRNIVYRSNSGTSHDGGFLYSQLKWLEQDLASVPKDKLIIFCVHIPIYNSDTFNNKEVLELLDAYDEVHILSGHSHTQRNYDHNIVGTGYSNIYEHNIGSLGGAWWYSNMCGDGSPNGYQVFVSEDNTLVDWYYIGYNSGMNTRSHQMRLYRGDEITGATISGSNNNGTKGYYKFNFGEGVLLANVYNADPLWKIEVYEDGELSGVMSLVPAKQRPSIGSLEGAGTLASPFYATISNSNDFYFTGYTLGILGRKDGNSGTNQTCYHMYQYTLKNKNTEDIKVVATDRFGNKYTETKITKGTDYSITGL